MGDHKNGYEFELKDCDASVTDRVALQAYRAKRAIWVDWIEGDEVHAIWTVLHDMIWSDVTFRSLSHLARSDEDNPLNNRLLGDSLVRGYLANQVLAIRRLLDRSKGRISIRRLLIDIRANMGLLTRQNYVCFDGLPYDYEQVKAEELPKLLGRGAVWTNTTGPKAWSTSERAHEKFDQLIGLTDVALRSPADRIPLSLIATVESWILDSPAGEIADWSHAYLAHAGNPTERDRIAAFTLDGTKITDAIRALARVTEGVSAYLLFAAGRAGSLMPVAQFDQFERLECMVYASVVPPRSGRCVGDRE